MRFVRVSVTLAAVGLAGLASAQAAFAVTPHIGGPIVSYGCPPVPMWCTKTLKPGITLTRWRAKLRSGTTQSIYKISWKLGDPHVSLMAAALNRPNANGDIALGTISHWAAASATPGLLGAINGDFFSSVGWSSGHPSGMLVQARHVVAFGSGGPGVGYEPDGRMVMGTPSAKPAKLLFGEGVTATIGAFDPGSSLSAIKRDQVVVKTDRTAPQNIPAGWDGYIVGGASHAEPLPEHAARQRAAQESLREQRLRDRRRVPLRRRCRRGRHRVAADRPGAGEPGPARRRPGARDGVAPTTSFPTPPADIALHRLATHSRLIKVSVDAPAWSTVQDVMGGKPQLVKNGKTMYPTAYQDPPMMSGDGWQWEYPHWRPAVAETKTRGWLIITGGVRYGDGVYGWNWGKMLVQLGAQNAMGFDNNSSTEMFAPGHGTWTFSPGWERDITEATALTYHPG